MYEASALGKLLIVKAPYSVEKLMKPKRMDDFIFFIFSNYGFYMTLVPSIVFQNITTKMNIFFFSCKIGNR